MAGRHVARKGRHARRREIPQGWGPAPDQTPPMGFPAVQLDPADELAMSYTPAPVYYPVPVPRPSLPLHMRLLIGAGAGLACIMVGAILILGLAFAMGAPEPANADPRVERQIQTVTEIPDQRVRVNVTSDRVKVVAARMCPSEDSCEVDYVGDGTWVIERVVP